MVPRITTILVISGLALVSVPVAIAQDGSTLGDYTPTTPTTPTTTPSPPTSTVPPSTGEPTPAPTVAPATGDTTDAPLVGAEGQSGSAPSSQTGSSGVKPSRTAGASAGSDPAPASGTAGETASGGTVSATSGTPRNLAFTGGQPVVIGLAGVLLMGFAVVMQRRRRGER